MSNEPLEPRRTRRRRGRLLGGALIAALMMGTMLAHADADHDRHHDRGRRLAGHRYVPSALVLWGFIENQFAATSSAGLVEFELAPGERIALVTGTRESKFYAVAQSFGGSVALTPWLALSARVTAAGVIPRDRISALIVGAAENFGAEAGVLLRLLRVGAFQLAARGDVGWNENRSTVPVRFPDPVLVKGDIRTIRPALIAALTLARGVGLQASGSFAWHRIDIAEEDHVRTLTGAAAATFWLDPVPVSLLVGAQASHDYGRDITNLTSRAFIGSDETRWRGEGGVFYMGRRDLDLGAVFSVELDNDDDDRRFFLDLRIGYYF